MPRRQFVVFVPKIHLFSNVFAVFSGTAHELMVPTKAPNTHPRPHLMQKDTTDFLNFPRLGTILGVQKSPCVENTIDTVIQLFQWL